MLQDAGSTSAGEIRLKRALFSLERTEHTSVALASCLLPPTSYLLPPTSCLLAPPNALSVQAAILPCAHPSLRCQPHTCAATLTCAAILLTCSHPQTPPAPPP